MGSIYNFIFSFFFFGSQFCSVEDECTTESAIGNKR